MTESLFIIDKYWSNNQYDNNNKTEAGGLSSLSSVIIGCQHTPSRLSRAPVQDERRGEERKL